MTPRAQGLPLVSILIPVHNAARFLPSCLASVRTQTLLQWECILADDGSTDGSAALCDAAAQQDARFRVLHGPCCGVSQARARARTAAQGQWIAFLDADDLYRPDFLSLMLNAVKTTGLPLACCGYACFLGETPQSPAAGDGFSAPQVLSAPAHATALLHDKRVDFGLWNKLYRADLIPAKTLDNGFSFNEDLLANWFAFSAAPGLALCQEIGYDYRQHSASASHRPLSANSVAQQWAVAVRIRRMAAQAAQPELSASADAFYYEKLTYLASMILRRADFSFADGAGRLSAQNRSAVGATTLAENSPLPDGFASSERTEDTLEAQFSALRAELAVGLQNSALGKSPLLPSAVRSAALLTVRAPRLARLAFRLALKDRQ